MNKRQRKKYAKKKGTYISNKELWNLDLTICNWIIPRLIKFKELTIGYPTCDKKIYAETKEMVDISFEDWKSIIDEIILAFELIKTDPMDIADKNGIDIESKLNSEEYKNICIERQEKIERGIDLFKYYFQDLWW